MDLIGADSRGGLVGALKTVLAVTFVTEAVSALCLFGAFLGMGERVGAAAWRAVFTAVSAFCNAGFAIQSDNLVSYAEDPFVLGVVGSTIVMGGLGPTVVAGMVFRRDPRLLNLHAKIVLTMTALLVVLPTIAIAALEWNQTLAGLGVFDKWVNAWFQSVTLRTAGFNSIDIARIQPATWTVMVLTMFIGGSPGSTAGGAKTTTIAVVVLSIAAIVRGREDVRAFGRRFPGSTVTRATAVTALGVLSVVGALVAIQMTQWIPVDVAIFEVVSALATVGLSMGGTAMLDEIGKWIIMGCMFAGRVGPLTLFLLLTSRGTPRDKSARAQEGVPIG